MTRRHATSIKFPCRASAIESRAPAACFASWSGLWETREVFPELGPFCRLLQVGVAINREDCPPLTQGCPQSGGMSGRAFHEAACRHSGWHFLTRTGQMRLTGPTKLPTTWDQLSLTLGVYRCKCITLTSSSLPTPLLCSLLILELPELHAAKSISNLEPGKYRGKQVILHFYKYFEGRII